MYDIKISEMAENACRSVMRVCADWESVARSIDSKDRITLPQISPEDYLTPRESMQCLSYLARMVTESESFTFARIRQRIEAHVQTVSSPMLSQLYEKSRNALDSTWDNALNAARDWLSIDVRNAAHWIRMKTLIELRNAAAHGGGSFTERQRKNQQQLDKIKKDMKIAGYEVQNFQIIAFRGAVRCEARNICSFINEVDELTR